MNHSDNQESQGAHSKLCDDATGTSENLDQVLYFGLIDQIKEIVRQRSEQFEEYGVTQEDVLNEIRAIFENSTKSFSKRITNIIC